MTFREYIAANHPQADKTTFDNNILQSLDTLGSVADTDIRQLDKQKLCEMLHQNCQRKTNREINTRRYDTVRNCIYFFALHHLGLNLAPSKDQKEQENFRNYLYHNMGEKYDTPERRKYIDTHPNLLQMQVESNLHPIVKCPICKQYDNYWPIRAGLCVDCYCHILLQNDPVTFNRKSTLYND